MKRTVNTVHLEGNWTLKALSQCTINSMSGALQEIMPDDSGVLQLDCRLVNDIDTGGRQLIDVWMQCARMRGFEPQLVNLPKDLQHIFKSSHTNESSPS